jgi:nucleoside-diphosphate-sugar epimerase
LSRAWKLNDRIRTEGSRNLADAAAGAGVERFVQESVAFLYANAGSEWIFEDHLVRPNVITASAAEAENQAQRLAESGCATVVLRFGAFYGPDSSHTITALRMARLGVGTTPGNRDAYLSSISTDDAAAAVMSALEAPSGTYNVVDDEPVTRAMFDLTLARAVGRERLRAMPGLIVRMLGDKLDHVKRSQRVSNRALREKTPWAPQYRSVREGLPAVAAALRHQGVADGRVSQDRNVTGADAGLVKPEDRE